MASDIKTDEEKKSFTDSIVSAKKSVEDNISGLTSVGTMRTDVSVPVEGVIDQFTPLGPVVSSLLGGSDEDEEEEEEIGDLATIETFEPIDREAYIEEYKLLVMQQFPSRRKNQFLHYKLVSYFKKRKMDHVFKDDEIVEEAQQRYDKKLDDLYMLREKANREQVEEIADMNYMKELCKEQAEKSQKEFKAMQAREKETAKGLIDTRTGKVIAEKQVERLIARQNAKSLEIAEIRLHYIRKKEKVKNLEAQLRALETIDGKLHLIEYEQLRMENQNFADKIEERDEELSRLRVRYNVAVQALAHVREKSFIVDQNIEDLATECMQIENVVTASRENVNDYKIKRDTNRAETNKLKQQSGLLTYTRLLRDMENSMDEVNRTREELALFKETHKENRRKLEAIRRTIEQYMDKDILPSPIKVTPPVKETRISKVYRGRPSLMLPSLPRHRLNSEII